MGRLFLFCIGGTGSRVFRSLCHLLASGVSINATEIVPIIIDPDVNNGDFTRTQKLLDNYIKIYNLLATTDNQKGRFFGQKISPLISLNYKGSTHNTFEDFIGLKSMSLENSSFIRSLFTEASLKSNMTVGFKGNPNVGSVVLNQLFDPEKNNDFKDVVSSIKKDDRIFIISSIFGGTGASGFPLLVKNLRKPNPNTPNENIIRQSVIGAVSLLPYFDLLPSPTSPITSASFVVKTKAALNYYSRNIIKNRSINAMYYIGQRSSGPAFVNNPGGPTQKNDAHFVELASALAIIDFMEDDRLITDSEGKSEIDVVVKEFGIDQINPTSLIAFEQLGERTKKMIEKPITAYSLFIKYLEQIFPSVYTSIDSKYLDQPWAKNPDHLFDTTFFSDDFFKVFLSGFNADFNSWLDELSRNRRFFKPIDMAVTEQRLFHLRPSITPKRSKFDNYDFYNHILNLLSKERKIHPSNKFENFIDLFYNASKKIIQSKLTA